MTHPLIPQARILIACGSLSAPPHVYYIKVSQQVHCVRRRAARLATNRDPRLQSWARFPSGQGRGWTVQGHLAPCSPRAVLHYVRHEACQCTQHAKPTPSTDVTHDVARPEFSGVLVTRQRSYPTARASYVHVTSRRPTSRHVNTASPFPPRHPSNTPLLTFSQRQRPSSPHVSHEPRDASHNKQYSSSLTRVPAPPPHHPPRHTAPLSAATRDFRSHGPAPRTDTATAGTRQSANSPHSGPNYILFCAIQPAAMNFA